MAGRDDIEFGTVKVPTLFRKIFIPTLLGMASWSFITVADGIFVGQGVGSHGIAAINICYPVFIILAGFALMVGMGASVAASIHLSKDNVKAARINTTQALWFASIVSLMATAVALSFPHGISRLLGASPSLEPLVVDYLVYMIPSALFQMWAMIGLFMIRLDGSPKYAMWCNVVPAMLNMMLDWVFIFPLGMGIKGAAIASAISTAVAGVMSSAYFLFKAKTLKLYRLKATVTSLRLTLRNVGYQCRIGFPALLGEMTMAMLMITGNLVFMEHVGDDGVAAFGVACYYLPFVFMFGNAIAESAQPIVSFNYGLGRKDRVAEALAISCRTGVIGSLLSIVAFTMFPDQLVYIFIGSTGQASLIAVDGFPHFAAGFLFFILNLVAVGFFQSIERVKPALAFALLRGVLFMIPCFLLLPEYLGTNGIWLAMPFTEAATTLFIILYMLINRKRLF